MKIYYILMLQNIIKNLDSPSITISLSRVFS